MRKITTRAALVLAVFIASVGCRKVEFASAIQAGPASAEKVEFRFLHDRSTPTSPQEKAALEALYYSTNGDNWTENTNWLTGDPCQNSWYGVTCDQGSIVWLILKSNNLAGDISPDFTDFPRLYLLRLNNNQLASVPDFNMPSLQQLHLSKNRLSSVPNFSHLPELILLSVDRNQLTSAPDFQYMTALRHLYLYENQLGSVADYSHLNALYSLDLSHNQLISVPAFSFPLMDSLFLNNNLLASVPAFNLPQLFYLNLSHNQLASVPDFGYLTSPVLEINLSYNQIVCFEPGSQALCSPDISLFLHLQGNPDLAYTWEEFCATGAGACLPSPEPDDQIIALENLLQGFIDDGQVAPNGSSSLFNQLGQAYCLLCEGNTAHTIDKLQVFITLTEAKTPNQIDPEAGQELIDAAQAIIDLLESGDFEVDCSEAGTRC